MTHHFGHNITLSLTEVINIGIGFLALGLASYAIWISVKNQKRSERLLQYQMKIEDLKIRTDKSFTERKNKAITDPQRGERAKISFNNLEERIRVSEKMEKEFNLKKI